MAEMDFLVEILLRNGVRNWITVGRQRTPRTYNEILEQLEAK